MLAVCRRIWATSNLRSTFVTCCNGCWCQRTVQLRASTDSSAGVVRNLCYAAAHGACVYSSSYAFCCLQLGHQQRRRTQLLAYHCSLSLQVLQRRRAGWTFERSVCAPIRGPRSNRTTCNTAWWTLAEKRRWQQWARIRLCAITIPSSA